MIRIACPGIPTFPVFCDAIEKMIPWLEIKTSGRSQGRPLFTLRQMVLTTEYEPLPGEDCRWALTELVCDFDKHKRRLAILG